MSNETNPYRAANIMSDLVAAAAGTYTSANQINENSRGVRVTIDVTAVGTTSVVFTVQAYDPASGTYLDLVSSAAVTTISTTTLTVYPGATAAANATVSLPLGRIWRVKAVVTGASSAVTATVCGALCA